MTRLELILTAILTLSTVFNVVVFVYARNVVSKLLTVSQELGDLQLMIDGFTQHLKGVYELDTFYGDQTLQNLLNHAESFNKQMETFEYIYVLPEVEAETTPIEKDTQEADDTEEN
jgi:hypothetical protein|tara:strand:- start:1943 stop:2290 length:348 start_codon:yes stop_codon:yes gene_type:complete